MSKLQSISNNIISSKNNKKIFITRLVIKRSDINRGIQYLLTIILLLLSVQMLEYRHTHRSYEKFYTKLRQKANFDIWKLFLWKKFTKLAVIKTVEIHNRGKITDIIII